VRFLLLRLVIAVTIAIFAVRASALDWPSNQELDSADIYERLGAWQQVEHLFSIEKLSRSAFARYASALSAGDCELAIEILWQAFTELEPEFARRARSDGVAEDWLRLVVPQRFPEHDFCDARRGFYETAARLYDAGKRIAPETAALGWAERRNTDRLPSDRALLISTLQVLFNVAHDDNPDAIHFVLEQDRIGRYVRLTGEQRLSLLVRLIRLGQARPAERMQAAKLVGALPLSTVGAARAYAAHEVQPEYERWQAYQARLTALAATGPPPGSP
jgi:hypothetical protein